MNCPDNYPEVFCFDNEVLSECPDFPLILHHLLFSPLSAHIRSKPLDVVYNRCIIAQLHQFFKKPWSGEGGGAYQQLGAELRSHTTAGIRHHLEELLEGENKVWVELGG